MTKRAPWPMMVPAGTTMVGTARVREDTTVGRGYAERELMRRNGGTSNSTFDEVADGIGVSAIASSIASSARTAAEIGSPAPLGPVLQRMASPGKTPKYRNTKCEHAGIKFDSQKERSRWFHLIQLEAAGAVRDLRLQVAFVLTERRQRDDGTWERASKYVADFVYFDVALEKQIVEDVKSVATRKNRTYIQKRKQMLDKHGISVKEI